MNYNRTSETVHTVIKARSGAVASVWTPSVSLITTRTRARSHGYPRVDVWTAVYRWYRTNKYRSVLASDEFVHNAAFLSRVEQHSCAKRDTGIAILSVCLSVRHAMVLY